MEISFHVNGLRELLNQLEALKNIENDPQINKALGRGAARIQGAVKFHTPVDTGNLRNKIFLDNPERNVWTVTTNVEYGPFVEFGTGKLGDPAVPHTNKESWVYYSEKLQSFITSHGQPPAHMFTKGFAQKHKEAFNIVRVEVKEIIRNA